MPSRTLSSPQVVLSRYRPSNRSGGRTDRHGVADCESWGRRWQTDCGAHSDTLAFIPGWLANCELHRGRDRAHSRPRTHTGRRTIAHGRALSIAPTGDHTDRQSGSATAAIVAVSPYNNVMTLLSTDDGDRHHPRASTDDRTRDTTCPHRQPQSTITTRSL